MFFIGYIGFVRCVFSEILFLLVFNIVKCFEKKKMCM